MTINKTKFVFAALVICSVGALIGSVTSTVAWYQYSSRVSAVYLGATANAHGNLKLRIKGTDGWDSDLTYQEVADYLESSHLSQKVMPITTGKMEADDAIKKDNDGKPVFYSRPDKALVERVDYDHDYWQIADNSMYVVLPLEICCMVKNDTGYSYLEKDVYISDLTIQEDYRNKTDANNLKKDLSSSVRVHISAYQSNDQSVNHVDTAFNRLISKNGGTILTEGYLDMDGDGDIDEYATSNNRGVDYHFNENTGSDPSHRIIYGDGHQTSYSNKTVIQDGSYKTLNGQTVNEKVYPSVVKSKPNSTNIDENDLEFMKEGASQPTTKRIGKTVAFEDEADEAYLNVLMTLWVEGWEPLPSSNTGEDDSPIWNPSDYIGSMFDVGIEFAIPND